MYTDSTTRAGWYLPHQDIIQITSEPAMIAETDCYDRGVKEGSMAFGDEYG